MAVSTTAWCRPAAKSAARSLGSGFGRAILRGTLGSILGGKRLTVLQISSGLHDRLVHASVVRRI